MRDQDIQTLAAREFGFQELLPGQQEIIYAVLAARDVLGILPTGGGKSFVYQFASQVLAGITVVVSPLIALMQDQVESAHALGIPTLVVNSTLSHRERNDALDEIRAGNSKLVYITAEGAEDQNLMQALRERGCDLFVVDEAHCVSDWGQDFRPAYLGLSNAADQLGSPTRLALTATATPWVRADIIERLGLTNPDIVARGVDRPNLFLEVIHAAHDQDTLAIVREVLEDIPDYHGSVSSTALQEVMQGSGIVYTRTIAAAEQTAEMLQAWGISADCYHGKRRKAERARVQDAFMAGELRVVAATNAFGMGVDKPDVRFVIHRDVPGSVEEYFQEAGRAGRDGNLARCTLIYSSADLSQARFLSSTGVVSMLDAQAVYEVLSLDRPVRMAEVIAFTGFRRRKIARIVAQMEEIGVVSQSPAGVRLKTKFDVGTHLSDFEQRHREYESSRVEMMRGYAERSGCRREYILNYFGEPFDGKGCLCDNHCNGTLAPDALPVSSTGSQFAVGQQVAHAALGSGIVEHVEHDSITILFENAGYKTLDAEFVKNEGVLRSL